MHRRRLRELVRSVGVWLVCPVIAGSACATPFTETSPTSAGPTPFPVAPVGGIVVDLVATNGNRVVIQLPSSSLPQGSLFFPTSPTLLGTVPGFTDVVTDQLGGQLAEAAVRLTVFDFDNAVGEFDFGESVYILNGLTFDNFSTIIAQATDDAGNPTGAGLSAGGFRNNILDTGWGYSNDPVFLANLLATIEATDAVAVSFADADPGDNALDFSRGVDAIAAGLPLGPILFLTLENAAITPTQKEVGRALDAQAGAGNDLEAVLTLILALPTVEQQRAALDAVAGRLAFMHGDTAIGAAEVQGFNIDSRLDALRRGDAHAAMTGVSLAFADDTTGLLGGWSRYTDHAQDTATDAAPAEAPALPLQGIPGQLPDDTLGLFVLGSVTLSDTDGSSAQLGSELVSAGVTLGLDTRLDASTVLGVALGFADNDSDFDDGSDFDSTSYSLSLYATRTIGDHLYLDLAAAVTYADMQTTRRIVFPGIDRTAEGETDGLAFSGKARLVYETRIDQWVIAPETALRYAHATIDGYTETGGGGLGMAFDNQHAESLTWSLGVTARRTWQLDRAAITPYAGIAFEAELLDDDRTITTAFNGDPANPFATFTDEPDTAYGRASLGVTARFANGLSAYADYNTLIAHSDTEAHTFFAGLRVGF